MLIDLDKQEINFLLDEMQTIADAAQWLRDCPDIEDQVVGAENLLVLAKIRKKFTDSLQIGKFE